MNTRKIVTANDLRGALSATIEGVLCGKVNIAQANAVSALSGELHKSIKQEWDMRVYANDNMYIHGGELVKLLEGDK